MPSSPVLESPPNAPEGDLDVALLDELAALTPYERFLRHERALELVRALRKAGTAFYGFDPRLAQSPR